MVEIKITDEFLRDADFLIQDFTHFMTLNLIHADIGLEGDCKKNVLNLIVYSNKNVGPFNPFFEYPLMNYRKKNIEKLGKNISEIMRFFYEYLKFAEPILQNCKPELYNGRFALIKKNYSLFYNKYIKV